jgi:hypothetical protein
MLTYASTKFNAYPGGLQNRIFPAIRPRDVPESAASAISAISAFVRLQDTGYRQ